MAIAFGKFRDIAVGQCQDQVCISSIYSLPPPSSEVQSVSINFTAKGNWLGKKLKKNSFPGTFVSKSCRRRSRDISTVSRLGFPFPQVPLLIPISWNVILLLFFSSFLECRKCVLPVCCLSKLWHICVLSFPRLGRLCSPSALFLVYQCVSLRDNECTWYCP